jgi:hypothetical protein
LLVPWSLGSVSVIDPSLNVAPGASAMSAYLVKNGI